jgi:hypothetical protein
MATARKEKSGKGNDWILRKIGREKKRDGISSRTHNSPLVGGRV